MATVDWEAVMNGRPTHRRSLDGSNLRFYHDYIDDPEATAKANGIPKKKEIEMLEVHYPGGDKTPLRVDDNIRQEYAAEYNAWKQNQEPPTSGTPLSEWSLMPRSVVEELRHFGIKTVEQLKDLPDEPKRRLGPLGSWCKKAKEWDKASNSSQAQVTALQEQLDRQTKRADKLEEQVSQLIKRIEQSGV